MLYFFLNGLIVIEVVGYGLKLLYGKQSEQETLGTEGQNYTSKI